MNKHKKTKILDTTSNELIGQFKEALVSKKDWVTKHYPRGAKKNTYMILGIACTSNKVNLNSRVILRPELLAEALKTTPIIEDHHQAPSSRRGTIIDSWVTQNHNSDVSKYVVFMGLLNLTANKDTVLTEYTKMNFSVGYSPAGTDLICPTCSNDSPLFINAKTKKLVCGCCSKPILDEEMVYDHGKHLRTGVFSDNAIRLTYSQQAVMASNKRTSGQKNHKFSTDTYLQAVYNPTVTELSMVLEASDSERAPLLASISIDNLYKYYDQLDSIILSDSSATNEELDNLFTDSIIVHQGDDNYDIEDIVDGLGDHQDQNTNTQGETMDHEVQNQLTLDFISEVKALNERFPNLLDSTTKELVLRDTSVDMLASPEVFKVISTNVDSQVYSRLESLMAENTKLQETIDSLNKTIESFEIQQNDNVQPEPESTPEPAPVVPEKVEPTVPEKVEPAPVVEPVTVEPATPVENTDVSDQTPVVDSITTPVTTIEQNDSVAKSKPVSIKRRTKK